MIDFLMSKVPSGLGILSTILIGTGVLGYFLRVFRKNEWLLKVPFQADIFKFIKKNHKYLAGAVLIIGPIHGYLALGMLKFHTGNLVVITVFIMFIIYILGRLKILKNWLVWHRRFAVLVFVAWGVHYFFPWAI